MQDLISFWKESNPMKTIITVICDNTISESVIIGDHGWSYLIERGNLSFLFDTGQGISILHNLKEVGRSISKLNGIFISHGHYDHIGSLKSVIKEVRKVNIFAHSDIFINHSVKKDSPDKIKYIGSPFTKSKLIDLGARFNFTRKTKEIFPGGMVYNRHRVQG